jgi:N-acetylglucosaminyldiphosphoundecaprenol N-acetyl-beta-D-mannosaminyltransferase
MKTESNYSPFINRLLMKRKLLEAAITTGSFQQMTELILQLATLRQSSYVCVANVHMVMEAQQDVAFACLLHEAEVVTPDGMPLVLALKGLYGIEQNRVAGMDLMPSLLREAEGRQLRVYLYGSTPEVLSAIQTRCRLDFPNLIWAGVESPPFRTLTPHEEQEAIDRINNSGAQLVLVALGCPKQEKWMASMKGKIHATMVGLGGAFPVYAGLQSRAPLWMQQLSLEWLYRLMQEPGRLWKRYLVTNTLFIGLLVGEIWRVRVLGHHPSPVQDIVVDQNPS